MVDLHLHSTFSDGSEEPEKLAELGAAAGLTAMALTDHDSLRGTARFAAAAAALGIQTVAGVEISVEYPDNELHMLGFGIDAGHAEIQECLSDLRGGRHARNLRMLAKLRDLGCPLDYAAVAALAGDGEVVGRPHIAAALLNAGYVGDKQEAFAKYLAYGAPAYCDRLRMGPERAMKLIRAAGGLPVLAHPHLLGLKRTALRTLVEELKRLGLAGIEAYHSQQSTDVTSGMLWLAKDLGLIVTGGSDFHGAFNPDIRIGVGFGGLRVPDECFDVLRKKVIAP
jgi:hypothetical protein